MSRPSDVQGLEDYDLVTLGAALGVCDVDLLTLSPARPRAAIATKTHDGVTYFSAHIDIRRARIAYRSRRFLHAGLPARSR